MKRIFTLVTVVLIATLFGCKDSVPPKTEVRVESASEAARNDDQAIAVRLAQQKAATDEAFEKQRARESRQQYMDLLKAGIKRWEDGLSAASLTPRFGIAPQITKLQAIRTEVGTIDVDDCTGPARATLQSSMVLLSRLWRCSRRKRASRETLPRKKSRKRLNNCVRQRPKRMHA